MTTNDDSDALREELLRLLKGLDYYRAWRLSIIERETGQITEFDRNSVVMPGSMFLDFFDRSGVGGGKQVLKDVQRWYSHQASDLRYLSKTGGESVAKKISTFLGNFREDVGFDFMAESGVLRKEAHKAIRLGKIGVDIQYEALSELENDLSQTILDETELGQLSELLRQYEDRRKKN